ncbi:MAG: HPF/RaiA family ribosome-associated protein [Pseudomonadota bacterium]
MQDTPEITFKNMDVSPFLEDRIRERIDRLERFHQGIIGCRVVVFEPHRSAGGGKNPLAIRVEVEIPGRLLTSNSEEEVRAAKNDLAPLVNHAFDAMESQLGSAVAKDKRQVKAHEAEHEIGRIARVFPTQGYGFVQVGEGTELYFTEKILAGLNIEELQPGDMVNVVRAHDDGPMGPMARHVTRLGAETRMPF